MKSLSPLRQFLFILKFSGRFFWQTDKKSLLLVMFLNSVASFIIVPNLLLDKAFIDTLIAGVGSSTPQLAIQTIIAIVAIRFSLATLRSVSNRFSGYFARLLMWQIARRAEIMIGQKYATIPVSMLEDPQFKDRYQKIEREGINRLQRVSENFVRLPQHVTGVISSLSIFAFTQPLVILFSLVSLLPSIVVDRWFIKKDYLLDTSVMLLHRQRGLYSYDLSRTRSYLDLRIFNVRHYLADKISNLWEEVITGRKQLQKKRRIYISLAGLVDDVVSYSLDGVFAIQALLSQITIGTAQAYVRAIANFKQSVSNLTFAVLELYENYLYLTDLVWYLDLPTPDYSGQGVKLTAKISSQIKFDHVWFKYPGTQNWILKDVNLEIKPGQNIAIVGKNGAGKTTLVKLLCGFYPPDKGTITFDGISVTDLDKTSLWKKISTLFQDSQSFGLTVGETIGLGNVDEVTDSAKIKHFSQVTDISDWIESLPLKYANPLSRDFAHGINPSSGQWQKIVIARSLFKNPEVLILDEPTSNVDAEAEEKIFQEILKIGKNMIILFISHRFSTVRHADKIMVLEDGTITESGSHQELIKQKGTYSRLFNLQAKNYQ